MRYARAFSKLTSKCFVPQKATSSPYYSEGEQGKVFSYFSFCFVTGHIYAAQPFFPPLSIRKPHLKFLDLLST